MSTTTSDEARTDLALIRAMMEEGRRAAACDGRFLALWGGLMASGFLGQYALIVSGGGGSAGILLWSVLIAAGWLVSLLMGRKDARRGDRPGTARRSYSAAWAAGGLAVTLYFAASLLTGAFEPLAITLLACALFGASSLVTAHVSGLNWLHAVGGGWYLLLVWYSTRPALGVNDLLILAGACGAFFLLPGILLIQGRRKGAQ